MKLSQLKPDDKFKIGDILYEVVKGRTYAPGHVLTCTLNLGEDKDGIYELPKDTEVEPWPPRPEEKP